LVRERFPTLDASQVMHRIGATSAHPAATGGHDDVVGSGMVPPHERDWLPARVALVGPTSGAGLLLLTLFVVHTVRRDRRTP
jgi:membrane-anchored mycosin MYCP